MPPRPRFRAFEPQLEFIPPIAEVLTLTARFLLMWRTQALAGEQAIKNNYAQEKNRTKKEEASSSEGIEGQKEEKSGATNKRI